MEMEPIALVEDLMAQGRYLEARFRIENQKSESPDVRLGQLYGLALSKSGMPEEARIQLETLYKSNPDDPETAGILGSIYKELFKKNQQTSYALLARDTYLKNFTATRNYYTGINAAAMSAMILQGSKSREIATEIIAAISPETTQFWELATLGEAYLLMKNRVKAIEFYVKARKAAGTDWGKISSVYNQLWLLNHYIDGNQEAMKIFHPPGIVAFVGHMIDHPSRKTPRFPSAIEPQIKNAIRSNLQTINAHIGFCSVACGSDILFAEAMAELGREVNILLPFEIQSFMEVSIRFAGEAWIARFKALIEKFPVKIITDEKYGAQDELFGFLSKIILGSSLLRSMTQRNKTTLLTVLSETELKQKEGGTNSSVSIWPNRQNHININPDIFISPTVNIAPSDSEAQTFESVPGRYLLNLVIVNISMLAQFHWEKVSKAITQLNSNTKPFAEMEADPDVWLYAFKSEFEAFEFIQQLHVVIRNLPSDQKLPISMHSGIVHKKDSELSGEAVDVVMELNKFSLSGIGVSEYVAAMMALQTGKYVLDFAGTFMVNDSKKYSAYRVGYVTK